MVEKNKQQLILIGVSVPLLIVIVLKSKDNIKELIIHLENEIEKRNFLNKKWFKNATDRELDIEREKIRLAYCSSGEDFKISCYLEKLLTMFDEEISKRAWGNEIPQGPTVQREHGWYLSKDD